MCKISINNMLWLALMYVVQNKHLPMLESRRYAVRHSQRLCKLVSGIIPQHLFFLFYTASGFENDPIFGRFQSQIINGYFLANFR